MGWPFALLQSFLSTVLLSLGIGAILIAVRAALRLPRRLSVDLGMTAFGALIILCLHLLSRDLFGFDPYEDFGFELAKHLLELIVIMMMLVAF